MMTLCLVVSFISDFLKIMKQTLHGLNKVRDKYWTSYLVLSSLLKLTMVNENKLSKLKHDIWTYKSAVAFLMRGRSVLRHTTKVYLYTFESETFVLWNIDLKTFWCSECLKKCFLVTGYIVPVWSFSEKSFVSKRLNIKWICLNTKYMDSTMPDTSEDWVRRTPPYFADSYRIRLIFTIK